MPPVPSATPACLPRRACDGRWRARPAQLSGEEHGARARSWGPDDRHRRGGVTDRRPGTTGPVEAGGLAHALGDPARGTGRLSAGAGLRRSFASVVTDRIAHLVETGYQPESAYSECLHELELSSTSLTSRGSPACGSRSPTPRRTATCRPGRWSSTATSARR